VGLDLDFQLGQCFRAVRSSNRGDFLLEDDSVGAVLALMGQVLLYSPAHRSGYP
jgi:hypothetical protein